MTRRFLPLLFLAGISASGCTSENNANLEQAESQTAGQTEPTREPEVRLLQKTEKARPKSDQFQLLGAEISGDVLKLTVEYSGGEATHGWSLYWGGQYREKSPLSVAVEVVHDDGGDTAEGIITEKVDFDLSILKEGASDEVTVELFGHNKQLDYKW